MTPRTLMAMVEAKRALQREEWRVSDMLQARQTADLGNLLYRCLYNAPVYPVEASMCRALDLDAAEPELPAAASDDEEMDMEVLMEQKRIADMMVKNPGGDHGTR